MTNVCAKCGLWRPDKEVDLSDSSIICPECGYRQLLKFLPLLIVGGPSGAGKSTVLLEMPALGMPVVLLDSDILWDSRYDDPDSHYRDFFEAWLRITRNINQSGRPCVVFGGGAVVPHNIEPCVGRRYFSALHYLALTADDDTLRSRLESRPSWRASSDQQSVQRHLEFSHWLTSSEEAAEFGITVIDTSTVTPRETAKQVAEWVRAKLGQ